MSNFSIPEKLTENLVAFMTTCFQKEMASVRVYSFFAWAQKNSTTPEQLAYMKELATEHEKNNARFKVEMYALNPQELQKVLSECKRIGFEHCADDLKDHLYSS